MTWGPKTTGNCYVWEAQRVWRSKITGQTHECLGERLKHLRIEVQRCGKPISVQSANVCEAIKV